ncbi:hypothetical protein PG996_001203 [Apiospora saccharicola]|uniref:AB hydrolase-1 domain-containing protein n=1 Tax=Apiospora saccharicola TaxID=335842 RepID=A0ABR1WG38_9PEZI
MKKTLLLCFIHGFQGGDDTFGTAGEFTEHLAALLSAELPKVEIRTLVYPKFETRGDLHECVARFRDWLLNKVIDLEVAAGTPSPTVDPGVRTVLIGHSMGGIVAAETLIALTSDQPVHHDKKETTAAKDGSNNNKDDVEGDGAKKVGAPSSPETGFNAMMFPYVQGVLAFDTPYLGIAPGVVAHKANDHYQTAASALTQLSGLTSFWGGTKAAEDASRQKPAQKPVAALEAPPTQHKKQEGASKAAGGGAWGNWGKMAMYAGAAGAVVAGGAAAYVKREQISSGWGWVGGHLEFVGCLAKGEEMKTRVRKMVQLTKELDLGFANLYTRLGKGAGSKEVSTVGLVVGNDRTFCNLPTRQAAGDWRETVNDKATDEISAHMAMFEPKENLGYTQLSDDAKNIIVKWAKNDWYETSSRELE